MTNVTTNAAATTLTTQDILDVTPRNGDLEILVGDTTLHVVGADGGRNVIFVDPNRDVHTSQTYEICLNDFLSLEKICEGYYRLTPAGVIPRRSQSSVDDGLELPF